MAKQKPANKKESSVNTLLKLNRSLLSNVRVTKSEPLVKKMIGTR